MLVITNNQRVESSSVLKSLRDCEIVCLADANFGDVLRAVRDRVHAGHYLLTHPLSGSIKPHETPYKSIALSRRPQQLDLESLQIIEDAIVVAQTAVMSFANRKPLDEAKLLDFQVIDCQLIENAIG